MMRRMGFVLLSVACAAGITGCGANIVPWSGPGFSGKVMLGGVPLAGARVGLYAAGTAGNGLAGSVLLRQELTTDGTGAFSVVPASYTCPAGDSVLYTVVTEAANTAVMLMSSPGACNAVSAAGSYVVNELTTAASAYAFAQFLGAGGQMGASATNQSGLALAAGTLANLVNVTTGTAPGAGFPATGTAPTGKLNSLANAVAGCAASAGACSGLLSAVTSATVPGNTLDALVALAKNPVDPGGAVYAATRLSSANTPALTAAPADWTLFATYKGGGMNAPSAVSIDSKGRVWVANYFSVASLFSNAGVPQFGTGITTDGLGHMYGGAVDANDVMWLANEPCTADPQGGDPCPSNHFTSSVTLLAAAGTAVAGSPYTAGGLDFPISVAVDSTNVSWIVDYGNSHLTLLTNGGEALSGTAGYNGVDGSNTGHFVFPVAVAVDGNRNGWVANQSSNTVTKVSADGSSYTDYVTGQGPSGVAVDGANNVWVANYHGNSLGVVSSEGKVLSGGGITGGGIVHPQGIAVDGANNVWVANYRGPSISEVAGVGSAAGTGAALSPAAGWGPDAALLEAFGLAIDASGNVWVTNFGLNTLTEFVGAAVPVKTPLLGAMRVP